MATFGQIPSNVSFSNFQVVTSSTRPSTPDEGDTIYETDTDEVLSYNGISWITIGRLGGWKTWTPTFEFGATAWTLGNATLDARYIQIGQTVTGSVEILIGSTTNFNGGTGSLNVSLPVAVSAPTIAVYPVGTSYGRDVSAPANDISLTTIASTSKFQLRRTTNSQALADSVPWVWAQDDQIGFTFTYEVK